MSSPVLHPSAGLIIVPFAFALGVALGAMRATLDRAFMNPTRIVPTMGYHVGFTTFISMNGQLLFFMVIAAYVVHAGRISFWPFSWASASAYGSVIGYGMTMNLYRKLYKKTLLRRRWRDDEL